MGDNYYDPRYQQSTNQRDAYAQNTYAQQTGYNTYQPPTDDGYRTSPTPQNLQVAQYDDGRRRRSGEYGSRPRSRHGDSYYDDERYSDRGRLEPPSPHSRRPSSRGSYREKDKEHKEHRNSEAKAIGATILGGVAGALIGRKAGHKDILPTVLGGVAGAWGGHKLEEEFSERHGKPHHERELAHDGRGRSRRGSDSEEEQPQGFREKMKQRIRSLSRKRTDDGDRSRDRSRSSHHRKRDDSADSEGSRHSRRRSHRYESDPRDRYENDRRDDRGYY